MTDEVSVSFKLSTTIMFTAGLLSAVIGVLVMGLNILNGYSNDYHIAVSQSTGGGIAAIVREGSAAVPIIYSSIDESINLIDKVILTTYNTDTETYGTSEKILYEYGTSTTEQGYMILLTKHRTDTAHVKSSPSPTYTGMQIITVGVDE